MDGIDGIAKDGMKLASSGANILLGIGGVVAGLALAMGDIGFDITDKLLEAIGIENQFLGLAFKIIGVIILMVMLISARNLVNNRMVKGVFTFLTIMTGTYLLVMVIKIFIGLLNGTLSLTGGA